MEVGDSVSTYSLTRLLDVGGLAESFAARKDDCDFAVKIYFDNVLKRKRDFKKVNGKMQMVDARSKLTSEISLLESLDHPGVIPLRDKIVNVEAGYTALVFDLMSGPLATNRIPSAGDAPIFTPHAQLGGNGGLEQSLVPVIRQIASALAYLHGPEVAVAHRDVKPENILIADDGTAFLTDFGVSTRMDVNFRVFGTEGTYAFLPPECCHPPDGDNEYTGHDGRMADVWSLGITIWAVLNKSLPFYSDSLEPLFAQISKCDLPDFDCIAPQWQAVLRRMLTRDPRDRASASEVVEMLSGGNDACRGARACRGT